LGEIQVCDIKFRNKKLYTFLIVGLTPNDAPELVLNKDGSFTLKPIAKKYYLFKPDMHEYSNMAALIYISFDGFKVKDIDYSEEKYKRIKADEGEFRPYKKVNLGVVYLDPSL